MEFKFMKVRETSGDTIHSPETVKALMTEEAKADRECFWVLHLNTANRIIEKELVSVGTVNVSLVHPREVFKKAILYGATSIITVHNHPGKQAQPSLEDRMIWERLDEAGKLLGIKVLDHIILTPSGECYSEKQEKSI
ncbi:MAG: JAB domain-containing protein [Patescibacteria group bacterium]